MSFVNFTLLFEFKMYFMFDLDWFRCDFKLYFDHLPKFFDLFSSNNDQNKEGNDDFLNSGCSAALKKADPIGDMWDPQISAKFNIFKKYQILLKFGGPTCRLWDPLFLARLSFAGPSGIKAIQIYRGNDKKLLNFVVFWDVFYGFRLNLNCFGSER